MSYREVWRKKMNDQGGSTSGSAYNSAKEFFNNEFENDISYRSAVRLNHALEETPIDIRIKNKSSSVFDKIFYLRPEEVVEEGDYIFFDDRYFIVLEYEYNLISPSCIVEECNEWIKTKDWELPCLAQGESYGVKMTATNEVLLETDTKVKITIGRNRLSDTIEPDFRFILSNSQYGIYKVGDITVYKKGVYLYTSKKDKYYEGLDDLKNGIAWQKHDEEEIEIIGADKIRVDNEYEYIINKNEVFQFTYDSDLVEELERTNNSIRFKCIKPNGAFKLIATSSRTKCEKNILTVR